MSIKPVVHYSGVPVIINGRALLVPVDHPDTENVSNTRKAWTSPIVNSDPVSGRIETRNTIYMPLSVLN